MAITKACGSHCGIRANAEDTILREGHCTCAACHDGSAPHSVVIERDPGQDAVTQQGDISFLPHGQPMCDRR